MEYEVRREDGKMIWYKLGGHSVVPVQVREKLFFGFDMLLYKICLKSRSDICVASFSRGIDCYNMISVYVPFASTIFFSHA
jgi:hypothetical protein